MKNLRKMILLFVLLGSSFIVYLSCRESKLKLVFPQHNAAWTRSLFFRGYAATSGEPLTMSDIKDFATTLKKNRIEYAYIFSGPFDKDGFLPDWAFSSQAIQSIQEIRKYYPEVKILPWVGGIQGRTVFIDNKSWRDNALAATKKLTEVLHIDGVHFDFEKLQDPSSYDDPTFIDPYGDQYALGLIQFHKEVRLLMPKLFVSSVVVSTAKDTRPWKRKHTMEELKQLFPLVDQISFLYYDTSIKDFQIFKDNLLEQLRMIKEIQDNTGTNPEALIAIGTFINEPNLRQYRDLNIESIPNSLEMLKQGIVDMRMSETLIDGIAIYCEWQTDLVEWSQIRKHWPAIGHEK